MNKLQIFLSKNQGTAPLMRCLAYIKNDLLKPKFIDRLIIKLPKNWKKMSILDVGSGPCNIENDRQFRHVNTTCFDIYAPYLKTCRERGFKTIKGDVKFLKKYFKPRSFDIVWAFDILEHLPKKDGFQVLDDIEKIARKQILIWMPVGWYPQDYKIVRENWQPKDKMLYFKNKYQQHVSSWYPNDFEKRGYEVEVLPNYHPDIRHGAISLRNKKNPVSADQMWAVKSM